MCLGTLAVCALAERTAWADAAPSRSLWIAPSYQLTLTDVFRPSSRHGFGAGASYEFHVAPAFNLGLTLAYRRYPGERATQQLGYGAILKHFFSTSWAAEDGFYPYVDYGLLLQQTFIEERGGSAISHDTRLGLGGLVRTESAAWFVAVAGHFSRLHYFEVESEWAPYLDVHIGWAPSF